MNASAILESLLEQANLAPGLAGLSSVWPQGKNYIQWYRTGQPLDLPFITNVQIRSGEISVRLCLSDRAGLAVNQDHANTLQPIIQGLKSIGLRVQGDSPAFGSFPSVSLERNVVEDVSDEACTSWLLGGLTVWNRLFGDWAVSRANAVQILDVLYTRTDETFYVLNKYHDDRDRYVGLGLDEVVKALQRDGWYRYGVVTLQDYSPASLWSKGSGHDTFLALWTLQHYVYK